MTRILPPKYYLIYYQGVYLFPFFYDTIEPSTKRKRGFYMYFIALVVFFAIVYLICVLSSLGNPAYLLDLVSLFSILLLSLPMLAVTGLMRDFFHSFSIAFTKKCTADKREIVRALTAIKMASKLFLLSGLITTLLGLLSVLVQVDDPALLGPNIAVAILSLLYSFFFFVLLLPVRARLELLKDSCE